MSCDFPTPCIITPCIIKSSVKYLQNLPSVSFLNLARQLTPFIGVTREKLTDPEVVKKFPTLYGTRECSVLFTTAWNLSLS